MKPKTKTIGYSAARMLGWLAGSALLVGALLCLNLDLNMFSWSPVFSLSTGACLFAVAAALLLLWFTARRTSDTVTHYVGLAVSLLLCAIAIYAVWPESANSGLLFGRSPSPLWYRVSRAAVLLVPLLFWMLFPLRMRRSLHNPNGRGSEQEKGKPAAPDVQIN